MPKKINMIGKRFGKLFVENEADRGVSKRPLWRCVCDCGGETVATANSLRSGNTASCGCGKRYANATHKGTGTRIYQTWLNMKARCNNKNAPNYHRYRGRGISVKWGSFVEFRRWALGNVGHIISGRIKHFN